MVGRGMRRAPGSAPAPGVVFRALAENNRTHGINRCPRWHPYDHLAGGGAPPEAPGALNFTHKYTLDTVRVRNPSGWA
jgi:hypothetical protein